MRTNEIEKKIFLSLIAQGDIILSFGPVSVGQSMGLFAEWYQKQSRQTRHRTRKNFSRLRRDGLLDLATDNASGKTSVVLTTTGRAKALRYKMLELRVPKMKRWDKRWRLVMFDIPEEKKKERQALRSFLKTLNFIQVQRSVWTHPYECKNEILFAAKTLDLLPHLRMGELSHIDNEEALKAKFKDW